MIREVASDEMRHRRLHQSATNTRDHGERKSLESAIAGIALERSRAGNVLHLLTGKFLEAREEEKQHIARELHDGPNQQLAILAVEPGMLVWKVSAGEKPLRESLVTLRKRAETLSDELRNMTHQLHPAVLEHLGWISALRRYCAQFNRHERIRVWFTTGQVSGPHPEVSTCLYRIVQEALRNVARHSGAKEAWVRSMQEEEVIQLSITDKGVGFHPDAVRDMPGLGLIRIRERVQLVNGQLDISAPDRGMRITVRVPMKWKEETK